MAKKVVIADVASEEVQGEVRQPSGDFMHGMTPPVNVSLAGVINKDTGGFVNEAVKGVPVNMPNGLQPTASVRVDSKNKVLIFNIYYKVSANFRVANDFRFLLQYRYVANDGLSKRTYYTEWQQEAVRPEQNGNVFTAEVYVPYTKDLPVDEDKIDRKVCVIDRFGNASEVPDLSLPKRMVNISAYIDHLVRFSKNNSSGDVKGIYSRDFPVGSTAEVEAEEVYVDMETGEEYTFSHWADDDTGVVMSYDSVYQFKIETEEGGE